MELHVLRVFVGPDGSAGNHLGVFLDGISIAADRRQAVAARLGFSETVYVDAVAGGVARLAIFTPGAELPFAGHPTVGTSWLLARIGTPVETFRVIAGDVATWEEGGLTWIRARPEWALDLRYEQLASPAAVDAARPPALGEPGIYVWAWEGDETAGLIRARSFPTNVGIIEDEATGAAAVAMGGLIHRPFRIRQGVGSEIHVRPGPDGMSEVGGRVVLDEVRAFE